MTYQALAVYTAFNRIGLYNEPSFETDRKALAAALRAAANVIRFQDQLGLTAYGGFAQAQNQFLAIAAELEGGE